MGKIFYLIGKSCTGKDTIYKRLLKDYAGKLKRVAIYTTRPIRSGEIEGEEYHFVDEAQFEVMKSEGKILEDRAYNTVYGLWRYFTAYDEQLQGEADVILIGVLSSYISIADALGHDRVVPIYIDLDDGIRLQRALDREKKQENPKYKEMCRRYIADSEDFSEEKIQAANIKRRFLNNDLEGCIAEIKGYIDGYKNRSGAGDYAG